MSASYRAYNPGRRLLFSQRNFTAPESRMMQDGATKEFQYGYNAQAVVAPVFSQIKGCMGFRRFSLRGFANAGREWSFVCAAHNRYGPNPKEV